jgi:hypothetical protein
MHAKVEIGVYQDIKEVAPPKVYQIRSGNMYITSIEDAAIKHYSNFTQITISEETGQFSVDGDFGTFSCVWTSIGNSSLHAFLYDLDFSYFMQKASSEPYRIIDVPGTITALKKLLIEARRCAYDDARISKKYARQVWAEIQDIERACPDSVEECMLLCDRASSGFNDLYWTDGPPVYVEKNHPLKVRFWEEVWKPFCNKILYPYRVMGTYPS